jgi:hypothetical protein
VLVLVLVLVLARAMSRPFRALAFYLIHSQGVALGCYVTPFQGYSSDLEFICRFGWPRVARGG